MKRYTNIPCFFIGLQIQAPPQRYFDNKRQFCLLYREMAYIYRENN